MDLRHHQFLEGQRYGVVGSLATEYPNRLTAQTRLLRDMRFNKGFQPWQYLDVAASKYVMVILLHGNEYLFDQQTWNTGVDNLLGEKLMNYITSNGSSYCERLKSSKKMQGYYYHVSTWSGL